MAIGSIHQTGLQGINNALQRSDKAAHDIASLPKTQNYHDLPENLVESTQAVSEVAVSAKVIKNADEMVGKLIDIMV